MSDDPTPGSTNSARRTFLKTIGGAAAAVLGQTAMAHAAEVAEVAVNALVRANTQSKALCQSLCALTARLTR